MKTSLNWLQKLIDNLPEESLNPSLSEIEEGEKVIGELTDPWLRKLLGTTHYLTTKAQQLHHDHGIQHLKGRVTNMIVKKFKKKLNGFWNKRRQ